MTGLLKNFPGWRTNRKIVVIESDDWGSIRMPSKEVYGKCLKAGYPVDKNVYERYDSLESEEDLELLFELLASFKDKNGNHPVITANCVVANPDFGKIKQDNFEKYHYELITETFRKYPGHSNCFNLWEKGMAVKIFHPQYHAREHLNVSLFMEALRDGNREAHFAFDNQMPGCIPLGPEAGGNEFIEPTNYNSSHDKEEKLKIFIEGLELFEMLFGYKSESVIPPNYIWSPDYNKAVSEKGVKYFQGIRKIYEPDPGGKATYHNYYMGKKNQYNQTYLIRNVFFEPSLVKTEIHTLEKLCLTEIETAFLMHKPAVIGTHRINYAGFIDESNRDKSLKMLQSILYSAIRRWPDIEFLTSDQLGETINQQS